MKGIVLAGGSGSRLMPLTASISKQLLPVYDKPMIYYPLNVLLEAGIKDIMIIVSPNHEQAFKNLLGDGTSIGANIYYRVQQKPEGIAQALIIGKNFIGNDKVTLILGDNIFLSENFGETVKNAISRNAGNATLFLKKVNDPERYGVAFCHREIKTNSNRPVKIVIDKIEEKPEHPESDFAVTGLYIYGAGVSKIAENLKPSKRGELEITDVNNFYVNNGMSDAVILNDEVLWQDSGTCDSLFETSEIVKNLYKSKGLTFGCIHKTAFNNRWIDKDRLQKIYENCKNSEYGKILRELLLTK